MRGGHLSYSLQNGKTINYSGKLCRQAYRCHFLIQCFGSCVNTYANANSGCGILWLYQRGTRSAGKLLGVKCVDLCRLTIPVNNVGTPS